MTSSASCPRCGAPLRPDASPAGLCPACLLSNVLQDDLVADVPEEDSGTLFVPGVVIGTFRIVSLLGRGGMATVYEAYDTRLERAVALKVLPPQFLHDQNFARRFEQEARVVARLEHPAIVPIYASGTDEGIPWMSMRLLGGGNMGTLLKLAPPDPRRTVDILSCVAEALDYAHAHGVVHRDIKPTNILFDGSNRPCVGDFGLAQMLEGNAVVTRTGIVVGTPHYMAPEQALGKGVDQRCDIYSLGIVAYEMLVGTPPFTGDSPVAVLLKHVNQPLPVPSASRLSEPLLKAIQKATAKDPSERWPSAGAFTEALDAGLSVARISSTTVGHSANERTQHPLKSVLGWRTIAAAAVLTTAALAWMALEGQGVTPSTEDVRPEDSGRASPGEKPPPQPDDGSLASPVAGTPHVPAAPTGSAQPAKPVGLARERGELDNIPPAAAVPSPLVTDPGAVTGSPDSQVSPPPPVNKESRAPEVTTPPPVPDVIARPVRIRTVAAVYPDVAKRLELEGVVVLQVTVGADGAVGSAVVTKSVHPLLDKAARDAVLQYKYSPGRRNGVPEAMPIPPIAVQFRLR